jgi:hypothetical protein
MSSSYLDVAPTGLALPLFVASVGADDANDALALDDLALGADWFDGSSYLHGALLSEVIRAVRGGFKTS